MMSSLRWSSRFYRSVTLSIAVRVNKKLQYLELQLDGHIDEGRLDPVLRSSNNIKKKKNNKYSPSDPIPQLSRSSHPDDKSNI